MRKIGISTKMCKIDVLDAILKIGVKILLFPAFSNNLLKREHIKIA